MSTIETTTLADPKAAERFLLAKGTHAPRLHPDINSESSLKRWNGWNQTLAIGYDAAGQPVTLEAWHFATGREGWSGGLMTAGSRLSSRSEWSWQEITWPVEALPALSVIHHPEHTPGSAT